MLGFIDDHLGWVIFLVLAALVCGIGYIAYMAATEDEADRIAFIHECTQYKKHYECVAMWRAGDRNDNMVVIPMPGIVH